MSRPDNVARVMARRTGFHTMGEVDAVKGYIKSLENRLSEIAQTIEAVDNRCMAVDGPVTPTLQEMTQEEISRIYKLASEAR